MPIEQRWQTEKLNDPIEGPRPFGEIVSVFVCAQTSFSMPMSDNRENRAQILRLIGFNMGEDVSFGVGREFIVSWSFRNAIDHRTINEIAGSFDAVRRKLPIDMRCRDLDF